MSVVRLKESSSRSKEPRSKQKTRDSLAVFSTKQVEGLFGGIHQLPFISVSSDLSPEFLSCLTRVSTLILQPNPRVNEYDEQGKRHKRKGVGDILGRRPK